MSARGRPEPGSILKVDGRWMQYKSGPSESAVLKSLQNGECYILDLESDYVLVEGYLTTVGKLTEKYPEEQVPFQEFSRIDCERDDLFSRLQIRVFGAYVKKGRRK